MSLIKCNECNHDISDKATVCPKCGCPLIIVESIEQSNLDIPAEDTSNESNESMETMETAKKDKKKRGIVIALILCVILVSVWGFVLNNSIQEDDLMRGMKFGMTYNQVKQKEKSPMESRTDKEDLSFYCDDSYYFPGEDVFVLYSFVDDKLDTINYITTSGVSEYYVGRVYRKIEDKYGENTHEINDKGLVLVWEMEDKRISLGVYPSEEAEFEFEGDYFLVIGVLSEGY